MLAASLTDMPSIKWRVVSKFSLTVAVMGLKWLG